MYIIGWLIFGLIVGAVARGGGTGRSLRRGCREVRTVQAVARYALAVIF